MLWDWPRGLLLVVKAEGEKGQGKRKKTGWRVEELRARNEDPSELLPEMKSQIISGLLNQVRVGRRQGAEFQMPSEGAMEEGKDLADLPSVQKAIAGLTASIQQEDAGIAVSWQKRF